MQIIWKKLDLSKDELLTKYRVGCNWDLKTDTFKVDNMDKPFTWKGVLSILNSLYNTLWFATPVTIQGKFIEIGISHCKNEFPCKSVLQSWQQSHLYCFTTFSKHQTTLVGECINWFKRETDYSQYTMCTQVGISSPVCPIYFYSYKNDNSFGWFGLVLY